MGIWQRWFGRKGDDDGAREMAFAPSTRSGSRTDTGAELVAKGPPDPGAARAAKDPIATRVAWLGEQMRECQAPLEIGGKAAAEVGTSLGNLFAVQAAKNGHGPATLFGMVVGADSSAILSALAPDPLLAEWKERLEAAHGAAGLSFYAEVAQAHGVEVPGADLRRGRYHLTFDTAPPRRSGSALVASDTPALRELEARLAANPDDVETLLVYADALQEVGHPRGELISMDHRIASGGGDPSLAGERERLLSDPSILPDDVAEAVAAGGLVLDWRLGFVRGLRIQGPDIDVASVLEAALEHPSFRLLGSLTVGLVDYGGDNAYEEIMGIIAAAAPLPSLQSLFIGDFVYPDESEMSWTVIGDASPIWSALPELREVTLQGGEIELGKIALPEVRRFAVRTGGLPAAAMESFARATWPRLEELEIWFGDSGYGAEATSAHVAELLAKGLPETLAILRLKNAEFTDELPNVLANSGVLARLDTLDLSMGTLSNEGCESLLRHGDAFSGLRRLDVSESFLSEAMVARLRAQLATTEVVADEQKDDDDEDFRYVSVGE